MTSFWKSKPPPGFRADLGHPLVPHFCYLLNERAGQTINEAVSGDTASFTNAPTWIPGDGSALTFASASTQYIQLSNRRLVSRTNGAFTIAIRQRFTDSATQMTVYAENIAGANNNQIWIRNNLGGSRTKSIYIGSTAALTSSGISSAIASTWHTDVYTYDGNGNAAYYLNGTLFTSNSSAAVEVNTTAAQIGVWIGASTLNPMNGDIAYVMGWRRILSPAQIGQFVADPYCFVQAPAWHRYGISTLFRRVQSRIGARTQTRKVIGV